MPSTTGKSQGRDPATHTADLYGDTVGLRLPAKAAVVQPTPDPAPRSMSGLLTTTLCVAVPIAAATVVLAVIEEVRNAPAVTHTTMLLLTAASAIAWIGVVLAACRDCLVRHGRAVHGTNEQILERQTELYRRQDHLAGRLNDITNRQVETLTLLRQVAGGVAAVRGDMADVIGVADADAELNARQAVNGTTSHPYTSGLYVVSPKRTS